MGGESSIRNPKSQIEIICNPQLRNIIAQTSRLRNNRHNPKHRVAQTAVMAGFFSSPASGIEFDRKKEVEKSLYFLKKKLYD